MKMVKHDYVVKLYEVLASRTKIFIVLELITGGELFDKIVSEGKFIEDTARYYFRQLVTGVKYCHTQGVCHRDLKPENLLLDEHGNLKISDFGLSALYTGAADDTSRATLLHTTCGTPNYVAPEVLNDRGYDGRAADVWSMGVILYVLLAGFLPFDEPHMSALFRKIQKAEFEYPKWFSPEVKALLAQIMVPVPETRITIADIERDPWYMAGGDVTVAPPFVAVSATVAQAMADETHMSHPTGPSAGATPASVPVPAAASAPAAEPAAVASGGAGGTAAPSSVLPHVPSAREIEEAVTEDVAVVKVASERDSGPKVLNAFDVVNMFGGMALNRILAPTDDESRAAPKSSKGPQFITSAPPRDVLARVSVGLTGYDADLKVDDANFKAKATVRTPKGEISVVINVYSLTPELHFVEIHRGKGDLLTYDRVYTAIRTAIGELATSASSYALPVAAVAATATA